jgi:hypothetical protein
VKQPTDATHATTDAAVAERLEQRMLSTNSLPERTDATELLATDSLRERIAEGVRVLQATADSALRERADSTELLPDSLLSVLLAVRLPKRLLPHLRTEEVSAEIRGHLLIGVGVAKAKAVHGEANLVQRVDRLVDAIIEELQLADVDFCFHGASPCP